MMGSKAAQFLSEKLQRPLNQFERDITNHLRVCYVCDKANPPEKLKNCKNCFCVAFCPECYESGKSQHEEKWCKALKIAAEDYKIEQTIGHQVSTTSKYINHYPKKTILYTFFIPFRLGSYSCTNYKNQVQ